MARNFLTNRRGSINYYVVAVMALIIVAAMWFFFSNAIQSIQEVFADQTASDMWATQANWNSWNLASTLMNNLWKFFLVFLVLGLLYYGYIEAQRRL